MSRSYEVTAYNSHGDSENRVHDDSVARRYGFGGGLVPGVTVYGYMVGPILDVLGPQWAATGEADVRFRSPCYSGDVLTVTLDPQPGAGSDAVLVAVRGPGADAACVTGIATLGGGLEMGKPPPFFAAPPLDERPSCSLDALVPGSVLAGLRLPTGEGAVDRYWARIGRPPAGSPSSEAWPSGVLPPGMLPPGMLLESANWALTATFVMPLWLHVGSRIRHYRAVAVGEPLELRGRLAREWERGGHRFLAAELYWVADEHGGGDDVVAVAEHTAIWHLAGT